MITDVDGVRVGHCTLADAGTGCTAIVLPEGTIASGEVRGGAPATREMALLAPERRVSRTDVVLLSGGSAFGLAACDGAMRFCEERGLGEPTPAGPVPIVVGMSIYDLVGRDPSIRPGPPEGYAACEAATAGPVEVGRIGAGTGARIGGLAGRPGGVVTASARHRDVVVAALLVLNPVGTVTGERPSPDTVTLDRLAAAAAGRVVDAQIAGRSHTTIGVVATNARLTKVECFLVAQGGHDGLARALDPPHTTRDGDALVTAATGMVDAAVDVVRALAVSVVADAVATARAGTTPPSAPRGSEEGAG